MNKGTVSGFVCIEAWSDKIDSSLHLSLFPLSFLLLFVSSWCQRQFRHIQLYAVHIGGRMFLCRR